PSWLAHIANPFNVPLLNSRHGGGLPLIRCLPLAAGLLLNIRVHAQTAFQEQPMSATAAPAHSSHTNRLAREKSPYLLQHQHNPVDWFAWGDEAFDKARRENKPILLSIGYSTCHWCHVMERESFE